jgi:hypothetical protein
VPWREGEILPYWTCRICEHRATTWQGARDHLMEAHREETQQLLAQSMIPEFLLLEKHLGEA